MQYQLAAGTQPGQNPFALILLLLVSVLSWIPVALMLWMLFRRISRWQHHPARTATQTRKMTISVGIKSAVLVIMVFAGAITAIRNSPVIESRPASLFCGAELLIALAILVWMWRDFRLESK